jgi:uncharacterized protein (DUF1778 family)
MKTARLDVRLAPEQKKLIKKAAALSGVTTSSFVQLASLEKARTVIREHGEAERIVLSAAAFERLAQALERPAEVVPELLQRFEEQLS